VGQNAAVIGEPAVAYFAKALVTNRWPLKQPITTEIMDPDNLDKRIKKTFHHFEMDDETRRYAARVLAAIGPPAVPTLSSDPLLKRSRPTARRYSAYALGLIGDDAAVVALVGMLQSGAGWQDRSAAASGLGLALPGNESARAPLERAARSDPDKFVRRKASEALMGEVDIRF
jgi:HEAT repeat protein